ncbi:inositol monophosphatase family protein [Embleya sp. NPDC020630]|uniref:inositol monophosphatase family protein n=1 Tax=Embleya sp. NPDC020630 TaxID=3363979 RepID=UPI0037917DE5
MVFPLPRTLAALRVAREAAQVIRRAGRPRRIRLKSSSADLVTATDLRVEKLVRAWLGSHYPQDAVVGEEGGGLAELDLERPTWFVDPLDGTTNFAHGLPHYACAIAFWDGERLALGVVADATRRRTYWAEAGRGAYEGRKRLHVSDTRTLGRSVIATGFPPSRATDPDNNLAEFLSVVNDTRDVRRLGCAGIDLSWVAASRLDAYWEQRCGPWDWAPGAILVREAGGRATTFEGDDWKPGDGELVASNGAIHDRLLGSFAEARAVAGLPARPIAA